MIIKEVIKSRWYRLAENPEAHHMKWL